MERAIESVPAVRATRRAWVGLAVLALPCFLYAMDLTVLDLAVPRLVADLHPSSTELLWIVDIYGFLVAGSLITMGTLGDRFGRRRVLLTGAVAFAGASLFAAFAQSAAMLIVARAVLGVAAATIAPSTLSLISNMFRDERERTLAVGFWVASFSAGGALGPMLGGILLEHFWWGSVFLLPLPVMALLLALGPRLLPEYRDPAPGRVDLASAVLSIIAVLSVIYGVKRFAADGFTTIAPLAIVLGVVVGVVFVRRQQRLAHPLLDLALFRHRPFVVSLAIYVLGAFAALGMFLAIAQYLQLVLGLGAFEAGAWTAPSGVAFAIGSLIAPLVARRISKALAVVVGLVVSAGGAAILALLDTSSPLVHVVSGYVMFAVGLSFAFALAVDLVVASAPPERAGSASAVAEMGSELGGAVGIAVLGSIINVVYQGATGAPGTLGEAVASGDHEVIEVGRAAFTRGMSITSAICAIALVIASIAAARYFPSEGSVPG
jgi:DHA2 family multidrug resistance protein-like MFS transporter